MKLYKWCPDTKAVPIFGIIRLEKSNYLAEGFAQNAYNIGKTGIQMYCKCSIMGESLECVSELYSMGHTSKGLLILQGHINSKGGTDALRNGDSKVISSMSEKQLQANLQKDGFMQSIMAEYILKIQIENIEHVLIHQIKQQIINISLRIISGERIKLW